jgi:hypothetical protein
MIERTDHCNQFYPRRLTMYQGDSVTWTINAHDQRDAGFALRSRAR